jgi:hypothetical protein
VKAPNIAGDDSYERIDKEVASLYYGNEMA